MNLIKKKYLNGKSIESFKLHLSIKRIKNNSIIDFHLSNPKTLTFSIAHFHLFEFWTLTSTQLLEHIRFLCLFPSLYPFLSPSLDTEISRRYSDIGCTPLLYALETSTASKGKFTVAIMNALMFQP